MACDCLKNTNALLAEEGQYVQISMGSLFGGSDRPVMQLYRKDTDGKETRRGKAKVLIPTCCPFCGTRYAEEPGQAAEVVAPGGGADPDPAAPATELEEPEGRDR